MTRSRFIRSVLLPLTLIGTLGAGVAVAGGPFGPGGGPGMHHAMAMQHLEALADELGLTEGQRVEIRTVLEEARTRGDALHERHEDLRADGIALFGAAELDPDAVESHRLQMLDAAEEATALASDTMLAVAQVLTPEQRAAAATKAEQFHADGGWRGRLRERIHSGEFGKGSH